MTDDRTRQRFVWPAIRRPSSAVRCASAVKATTPQPMAAGALLKGCRRRPTLPRSLNRSTIGAVGLNDRVRNGNECGPYALVASVFVEIVRQWEWVVFGGAN